MHPICSWMVTIDLVDDLEVTALPPGSLSRYAILWHPEARRRSEIDWSISKDLAVRAHLAIEQHTGRSLPVQMKLEKRIPVGGGLGGGSSNAAAMLRAVNQVYQLELSPEELRTLGAGLGSDIPFLVTGGSAIVEGLGDQVARCSAPLDLHAVLIFPEAACPTGPVYAAFDRMPDAALNRSRILALTEARPIDATLLFNDLTKPAQAVAPTLEPIAEQVRAIVNRPVHVSGSGSTLFVIADDALQAASHAELLEMGLGLPVMAVRSIPATEV